MKILLEMRPALDGHAGIPQETRLLFRALNLLDGVSADGLVQTSGRVLAAGLADGDALRSADQRIHRLARVVVSLQQDPRCLGSVALGAWLAPRLAGCAMLLRRALGLHERLGRFDPAPFRDFIWRALFARTLHPDDFDAVTAAGYRIARVPWTTMHVAGLAMRWTGRARYPVLDTRGYDVMIAETPYPAHVARPTQLVVRYHDAIPLLMPHTISDKAFHHASHYHALRCNVRDGAYFACVSEATRRDLVSIFPQVEPRAVTIPNMVSHHYFDEPSSRDRVPEIVRTRLHPQLHRRPAAMRGSAKAGEAGTPPYLLMVSTLEPRKNHRTLVSAWEQLKSERWPALKLVLVGMLGWDHEAIIKSFRPWIDRGELFVLEDVPAAELRQLYRHANATVCPSFGEGFDFSGVEAMRCGGVVAASDIVVHRDVYADAARYFSPYSASAAAAAIAEVIDPDTPAAREALIRRGADVSARYTPENVLPLWRGFLDGLKG